MLSLSGYRITSEVYESLKSLVYRGYREFDLRPVIFKVLKPNYPTPDELTRYRQEYEITKSLSLEGVIKVYGMQTYQNSLVMFLEDFGGESLKVWLTQRSLSLEEVLSLGIQLTTILAQVHQQQVIHKDVNPSNIVWNPRTKQLKLIDFGIATRITRETSTIRNPNLLEGTLAYMSPEQTGRMNRSIDYRTDFYSLGVTLYELLTQQLPFTAEDALELVHCHLAKRPLSPVDRHAAIPQVVSDIVMKLLSKTAEERYQSCRGIQADLQTCLNQLQSTGSLSTFPLAQQDVANIFQIPQKLYGRDREVAALLEAFERISRMASVNDEVENAGGKISSVKPQVELMLISGYSGIGKTALVQEIYKPITKRRGYFISGKFDQYQRDIPYSAFVTAFSSLVGQLLTEPEIQLCQWRSKLLAALDPNAQVIIGVIPELELILGQQPPVSELPPIEAKNRFNQVFQQFIRVVAQPEHPLVIFLDDLQWVDAASLQLMQLLIATAGQPLFLLGAYRDNEVNATHPLVRAIEKLKQAGVAVHTVALSPLQINDISQLLADTLNRSLDEVAILADLVLVKTNGNPFFVNEFLRTLYVENLLQFDPQQGYWHWSIADIQQRNITDNVVELLITKIQRLQQSTQNALQHAACMGNQFDLPILTCVLVATGHLPTPNFQATIGFLAEAVTEGFLIPLNDIYRRIELGVAQSGDEWRVEYKFAHDRIQQAAYSLIPETERSLIHWQIGQQLRQNHSPDQQSQKLFDAVNQLNLGRVWVRTSSDREMLARLNLLAGEKAKASAAYNAALRYFESGLDLLTVDCWQTSYALTLALYSAAAEAAYLSGDFAAAEQLSQQVLDQAESLLDCIKVYDVKIQIHVAQSSLLQAVQVGLQILQQLGVNLPPQPMPEDIQLALATTASNLTHRRIEDLIDLPMMSEPYKLAAMQLLASMCAAAFLAVPPLFPIIVLKMVDLLIEGGNMMLAPFAYAAYGIILSGVVLEIEAGYQFGQLSLKLLERLDAKPIQARTLFPVNDQINVWKIHLRESLKPLQECYQVGVEQGDLEFAGYAAMHFCGYSFAVGQPLDEVQATLVNYLQAVKQINHSAGIHFIEVCQQTVLHLKEQSVSSEIFVGEVCDEANQLSQMQQTNFQGGLFFFYLNKLFLCYLFYDFEQAITDAAFTERYLAAMTGTALVAIFRFYDSLARLAVYPTASVVEQANILEKVAANQELMHLWATHAPMNYLHKWYLVKAEQCRVLNQEAAAIEAYDRAAALAREQEYLHEEAIVYERTGLFYLAREKPIVARAYLQEAQYCYLKWGATAKVEHLQQCYPQMFSSFNGTVSSKVTESLITTGSSKTDTLDLATVMKASQVLSGELHLQKLLTQLMLIVLQNAGAQRGVLLLDRDGKLQVEAVGTVEPIEVLIQQLIPPNVQEKIPHSLIQYVARKQENLVLGDASCESKFSGDAYIQTVQPKSVLCMPIRGQGKLIGVLYLENNLTTDVFTADRTAILKALTSQAAIALKNAQLYEALAGYSQMLEVNNQDLEREVNDRRRAEERLRHSLSEREVLLKEIHHRVKNNLQIISGLLQLQAHSVTDPGTVNILRGSQHRIDSMSLIHKKLYASSDFGQIDLADYVPALANSLLMSYQITPGTVTLQTDIDPITLNIDQAIPCGLIINELISNALKYAFPDHRAGKIQIYLRALPNNQVELIIQDDGVGLPEGIDWEYNQSLGLSLVHDLAVEQLEGDLTVERHSGTTFSIHFPQAPLIHC